jgi:gas vesicle protein
MNAGKFWAVFAIGVAAGAAVALTYAPQTGTKTRRQLRRGLEDAGDYLKEAADTLSNQAQKYAQRGKDIADDVSNVVGGGASSAYTAARKAVSI